MKNNLIQLLKFLPKWKIILYILLAFFLAAATGVILLPAVWFIEENSRFFESLLFLLAYFLEGVLLVFYIMVSMLYLLLFYHYERKRYLEIHLEKMTEDVQQLAQTERAYGEIPTAPEFMALAEGIQTIIAKSEEAILEVKKAEQVKNELITNVAHDLRSPLTSIIGYLDVITNDRYRDEVELRHYVQVIHDKAASLHALINDIFEYTYMQNQHIELRKDFIHIEEMLNQLAVQSKMQWEEAGMKCRVFSSADNPVVEGDGGKLARVFENLIQNAIRYGSEGKNIDIRISDTEKAVNIEITNYGQAIPRSDLPHIFDRFYRVDKSRSQLTGGSGLGLAISKSIVDLHGGKIEADSVPGKTTFTVRLLKQGRVGTYPMLPQD